MGYFQVSYNSRVVIYDRRAFIRLATYIVRIFDGIEQIFFVVNEQIMLQSGHTGIN